MKYEIPKKMIGMKLPEAASAVTDVWKLQECGAMWYSLASREP